MDLYNDIYQLLKDKDCVIIPGFGGFIANYFEAKIDLKNQEFFPPSRKVAFNENLQNNDGLLINHLTSDRNISWNSASEYVQNFVEEINDKLKIGETIKFDKLGQFTKKTGVLIFSPNTELNLLEGSFGLSEFNFPMLKTGKTNSEPQSKPSISKTKSAKANQSKRSRKTIWTTISVAATVTGLAVMAFQFGLFNFDNNANVNFSNVVPVEIVSKNTELQQIEVREADIISEERSTVSLDTLILKVQEVVSNENIVEKPAIEQRIFAHTIAGSFSSIANAEALQNELKNLGFSPIILPLHNGLYRVSVKSYSDRNVAVDELEQLRTQLDNQGMWVLFM